MTKDKDKYIPIQKIAKLKGLKSTRSIRNNLSKYIYREVKVKGGTSYEILTTSLEPELQHKLMDEDKFHPLVPLNNKTASFVTEKAQLTALARVDLIKGFQNFRTRFKTRKEAMQNFLELYNSGLYLKKIYEFIGSVSRGTIDRWIKAYDEMGLDALMPQYRYSKYDEYDCSLDEHMKQVLMKFLLHPNKITISKAISLTRYILENEGCENIPSESTFRRYANHFKDTKFDVWTLMREGEKALNDKVEPYIERDLSKIEVGDVFVADGHVLNFEVINPFTGKPTRATLVGFLDWKSTALVGYEIMMTENTQCIASALRNAILNLGKIPKIVYQDNGRAFKAKYFQHCNFNEEGFNGVYENLGIKPVFAKPYNAKAKVIERFFKEFAEFEKLMNSYIGTSISEKPPRLNRGEKFHKKLYEKSVKNKIPTVQQTIKLIDYWLNYHNSKPCPNAREMSIKDILNSVAKQKINQHTLDYLMMKSEIRTIQRNGISFLDAHYFNEMLVSYRERVYIRYSLFDISKVLVYSLDGQYICTAHRVTKTNPMANHLGSVADMEDFRQKIQKQKQRKNRILKKVKEILPDQDLLLIDKKVEDDIIDVIPEIIEETKTKREKKPTLREDQMNRPLFSSNYERYEWFKENGCTSAEDREWVQNYKMTDEYKELYE